MGILSFWKQDNLYANKTSIIATIAFLSINHVHFDQSALALRIK